MNPGATARPSALMMRVADSLNLPTPTILPFCTATSAVKEGPPEPSTTQPFLMSRSYAMTLPPLGPDTSGPVCHLSRYASCPSYDLPAQVLLGTSVLYAIEEVRSIADMLHRSSKTAPCRRRQARDVLCSDTPSSAFYGVIWILVAIV